MQVNETNKYLSSKKKFTKDKELLKRIEEAQELFTKDKSNQTLHFKKINCKKDKKRHSIRIPGTQYRILMTILEDTAFFHCVCNHTKYEFLNKNC